MNQNAEAINILSKVIETMDTIPVRGIDNQDKFVGCANAVQHVIQLLQRCEPSEREVVNNG